MYFVPNSRLNINTYMLYVSYVIELLVFGRPFMVGLFVHQMQCIEYLLSSLLMLTLIVLHIHWIQRYKDDSNCYHYTRKFLP